MFSTIFVKSFQIGERMAHVLCDTGMSADDLEKLGVDIIKVANDIKAAHQKALEEASKSNPEEQKEEVPEGQTIEVA